MLSSDIVLTAAHCVLTNKTLLLTIPNENATVVLGEHDRTKEEESEQRIQVKEIIIHPGYWKNEKALWDNDFAIIKLAKSIKFTKFVNPICLPQPNSNKDFDSVEARASGWGHINKTQGSISNILRKVSASIQHIVQMFQVFLSL